MEVPAKFRSVLAGYRYWFLALVFIATSTLLVSCGSGGTTINETSGGGGGTTSFTLTYLANVTTGETTPITANVIKQVTLLEGGTGTVAAEGVTVSFQIIDNQSLSALSEISAVTDEFGKATVTYTAGTNDTVTDTVRVRISGVGYDDAFIAVNPVGLGSFAVAVSSDPTTLEAIDPNDYPIPETITNQSTISATVTAGGTAQVGVDVTFTTTAGTLCDYPNCTDAASTAQTDANGVARIILQSSTNLGTATVKAQYDTASDTTAVTFVAGPAYDFTMYATPSNMTADNISTSTVTVVVRDAAGHIVADGTSVDFSLKATSTGSGDFVETPPTAQTTNGVATVTFKAGTTPGPIDIRASSGGVNSDDSSLTNGDGLITLITELVGSVTLTLDSSTLTANGTDFTVATATVLNTNGNPVNPGTSVTFATTSGDLDTDFNFTSPVSSLTTATAGDLGQVSLFLRSSTDPGQYFVTASSGSKSAAAQVTFEALPTDPANSYLTVTPLIIAKGGATAIITLTARDSFNNPVSAGKTVGFTVSAGGGVISGQTPTDGNGVATATITSSNTAGTYDLAATIDGVTINTIADHVTPTQITYGAGIGLDPNTVELDLSATFLTLESPGGSDFIKITATVTAVNGETIPNGCGANIEFSIADGPADALLDGSTGTVTKTTTDGVASVLLSAGTTPGTVRVQVSATKDSDCVALGTPITTLSTAITIASGPAANLFIYRDNTVIDNQDGSISILMSALVTDQYGNPVEDGTAVFFSFNTVPGNGEESICPEVYTGDTPESACVTKTTSTPTAIKGVARSLLTWPALSIFTDYDIIAETLGGTVSSTYDSTYPAVAPVEVIVDVVPTSVASNTVAGLQDNIGTVTVTYQDGATFPNPISNRSFDFYSDNPQVVVDATAVQTDEFGYLTTTFDVGCVSTDTTVTITAADADAGQFFGEANITVKGIEGGVCP